MICDFTYDEYRDILSALTSNYDIVKYETALFRIKYDMGSAFAIVRHDIDSNLHRAMKIAHIDCQVGVRSTFFLLVNSELYNLFSENGESFIQEIYELGHDIGLHYDPTSPNGLQMETEVLGKAIGKEVKYLSIHCPSTLGHKFENTEDLLNVSDEPFMTYIKYFADSEGSWKFGHPLDSKYFADRKPLHINFHPAWWNDKTLSRAEILEQLVCDGNRRSMFYMFNNLWR